MKVFNEFPQLLNSFKVIKPLSNFDIIEKCIELNIKNFKGVFMRDEIKGSVSNDESLILNIDDSTGDGTHWTCLFSKNGKCLYFDSYGFEPPIAIQKYCGVKDRLYNSFKIQAPNEIICGHYCIYVLYKLNNGALFTDVLNELYERNNLTNLSVY